MLKTYCDMCNREPSDDLEEMTWLHIRAAEHIDSSWQIFGLIHLCGDCVKNNKSFFWIQQLLK